MRQIFPLLFFTCVISSAIGQTGKCPKTPIFESFDAKRYSGLWYEIERFPIFFQNGLDCVTAEYGFLNATSVTVKNKGVYLDSNNEETSIDGIAYVRKANEPNRLLVEFAQVARFFKVKGTYDVWSTDYETYSLVYSCKSILGLFKIESAWILSRNKELDEATIVKLKSLLSSQGVNVGKFTKTKQTCDN